MRVAHTDYKQYAVVSFTDSFQNKVYFYLTLYGGSCHHSWLHLGEGVPIPKDPKDCSSSSPSWGGSHVTFHLPRERGRSPSLIRKYFWCEPGMLARVTPALGR